MKKIFYKGLVLSFIGILVFLFQLKYQVQPQLLLLQLIGYLSIRVKKVMQRFKVLIMVKTMKSFLHKELRGMIPRLETLRYFQDVPLIMVNALSKTMLS